MEKNMIMILGKIFVEINRIFGEKRGMIRGGRGIL